jgi:hypothetical protein
MEIVKKIKNKKKKKNWHFEPAVDPLLPQVVCFLRRLPISM